MSWNYRIVKALATGGVQSTYSIREITYIGPQDTPTWVVGPGGDAPTGTTIAELVTDFDKMAEAFHRPVLIVRGSDLLAELPKEEADRYRPGFRRTE